MPVSSTTFRGRHEHGPNRAVAGIGLGGPRPADQGRGENPPDRRDRPLPDATGRTQVQQRRRVRSRRARPSPERDGVDSGRIQRVPRREVMVPAQTEDIDALRSQIRGFLESAPKPAGLRNYGPTPTVADVEPGQHWHRYLADHGYTCLHWPREFGGADATVAFQAAFAEECARAGVPRQLNITGADLVGPVLIKFGSQEQKDGYLEPIRLGDDVWCQLFSEPGAGSDLAGVRTRAERTATGWRIDGQKVWSSAAASAHFGLLLARTGPDKHRGLSMFVVPMDIPGVTVRPLTQMDGESKFNEVFFDGAELDEDALIGEVGQGWTLAMVTLGRERLTLGSQAVSMFRLHQRMVDAARDHDLLDPVLSGSLTRVWARLWLQGFSL